MTWALDTMRSRTSGGYAIEDQLMCNATTGQPAAAREMTMQGTASRIKSERPDEKVMFLDPALTPDFCGGR